MSNFPPGVAPSSRTWLGIAREIGGGGSPASAPPPCRPHTIPLDKSSYEVEDMPKFLEDIAIRGSMSQRFADVLGVVDASFSFGGPVFGDVWGYFFDNLFGDLSHHRHVPGQRHPHHQLGRRGRRRHRHHRHQHHRLHQLVHRPDRLRCCREVVILNASGGTAATTLNFCNYPLRFAHGSAATVVTVTGPYTHTFTVLNSTAGYGGANGAQPPTHSLTDNTYLTPGVYGAPTPVPVWDKSRSMGTLKACLWGKRPATHGFPAPAVHYPHQLDHLHRAAAELAHHDHHRHGRHLRHRGMDDDPEARTRRCTGPNRTTRPRSSSHGALSTAAGRMKFTVPSDETPLNYMLNDVPLEVQIVTTNGQSGTT